MIWLQSILGSVVIWCWLVTILWIHNARDDHLAIHLGSEICVCNSNSSTISICYHCWDAEFLNLPKADTRELGWQDACAIPVRGAARGLGEAQRALCSSLWETKSSLSPRKWWEPFLNLMAGICRAKFSEANLWIDLVWMIPPRQPSNLVSWTWQGKGSYEILWNMPPERERESDSDG